MGEQLIKNESIALVELVKNSYDADASTVDIIMENPDDPKNGIIIIEDDGYGMDATTVENVWLEPGSDFKSKLLASKTVSPKYKRLPIGEKGIGRFGVHKLGKRIELTTKKENAEEVYVKIDWTDFDKYEYLDQVPVSIIVRSKPKYFTDGKTGTNIVISKLKKEWKRGTARAVKRSITALSSPFKTESSFTANFDILDKPGWFEDMPNWEEIKEHSLFYFKTTIKDDEIKEFLYEFTPWPTMPKLSGREIHLTDSYVSKYHKLTEPESETPITLKNKEVGEFVFEGYIFDQDARILSLGVQDKKSFKDYLRNNGGVRVFRDGLRVYDYGEPENDWLSLDLRRVNIPTKRLSNNIIIGAIYLNRETSSGLIEKANREGFVENDSYSAFRDSILHTIEIIENLRYTDKQKLREIYGPTAKSQPVLQVVGDLKLYIEKNVTKKDIKEEIIKSLIKIENDYKVITDNLLKAAGAGLSLSVVVHEVEKIIIEVEKVLVSEKASPRALKLVKHLSSLIDGYSQIIRKSTQTSEDIKEVVNQSIFNEEYRLDTHSIKIEKEYLKFKGNSKVKMSRSLVIGSIMNILDNSIYWLEKSGRKNKKIIIDISEEEEGYINLLIADNGTGFLLPTDDITEPFVSAKPGGMGLGLHIASEIMIAQKGKLIFPEWGDFSLPDDYKGGAIIAFGFKKNK